MVHLVMNVVPTSNLGRFDGTQIVAHDSPAGGKVAGSPGHGRCLRTGRCCLFSPASSSFVPEHLAYAKAGSSKRWR